MAACSSTRRRKGAGAGALNKIAAYAWQTCDGFDTVQSDRLVCASDERREYAFVTTILGSMSVRSIRLLTDSAFKLEKVRGLGVRCTQARLPFVVPWRRSLPYLECTNSQMRHAIEVHALSIYAMRCLDHTWTECASDDAVSAARRRAASGRLAPGFFFALP